MEGHNDGGVVAKSDNKWFIVALCSLVLIAIGLVISIVVVTANNQNNTDNNTTPIISDDTPSKYEEEMQHVEEIRPEAEAQIAEYNDTKSKSETLLNSSTTTPADILSLYNDIITRYLSKDSADRLSMYIKMRNDDLLAKGFKEAALDELLKIDYSMFNASEQYKYYSMIIAQASELGRSDVVTQYEPLLASVKEAYDRNYSASDAAAAEAEANRKEGIGWDEWQASK